MRVVIDGVRRCSDSIFVTASRLLADFSDPRDLSERHPMPSPKPSQVEILNIMVIDGISPIVLLRMIAADAASDRNFQRLPDGL